MPPHPAAPVLFVRLDPVLAAGLDRVVEHRRARAGRVRHVTRAEVVRELLARAVDQHDRRRAEEEET